jgi:hypothetical protein
MTQKNHLPKDVIVLTIPIGTALSNVVNIGDFTVCALEMPSAWTAAAITFLGATPKNDEITQPTALFSLNTLTGEYSVPSAQAAISKLVILDPATFSGIQYIQIRSGIAATPVNQAAARSIRLYIRPIMK